MLTLAYADGEAIAPTDRQVNAWFNERGDPYARAFSRGTSHRIEWPGVGVFAFSRGSTRVRVTVSPGAATALVEDTFTRLLQPLILQALGWQALHASAVAGPGGVWAFCGRSGSGKSTLAFALARAGYDQFADDAVVLGRDERAVVAQPVPFVPRLEPPSRRFFAPDDRAARKLTAAAPVALTAIFLLTRNTREGEGTSLPRLAPAAAFSALLAHAHCFDPNDREQTLRLVSDYLVIAEAVPIFACAYRPGFAHVADLVAHVERAGSSVASHHQARQCAPFG